MSEPTEERAMLLPWNE